VNSEAFLSLVYARPLLNIWLAGFGRRFQFSGERANQMSCAQSEVRSALCRPSDGHVGAFVDQPDSSVGGNDPISGRRGKTRPSETVLWMKTL
jgi:hypothetical protein